MMLEKSILTLCLLCCINVPSLAANATNEFRGELLYTTNCDACHDASMHWRDKKLAKDWKSLKGQVTRWQTIAKASWNAQDIVDVTLYLNNRYYHYLITEPKAVSDAAD
jgi:hypothetical protein